MKLLDELDAAIVDPDGIDMVPTTVPQGLIRRAIMEIKQLTAARNRASAAAELMSRHDKALPGTAPRTQEPQ